MVKPDGSPDEDSSPGSSQVAPVAKGYAHLLKVRENFSLSLSLCLSLLLILQSASLDRRLVNIRTF